MRSIGFVNVGRILGLEFPFGKLRSWKVKTLASVYRLKPVRFIKNIQVKPLVRLSIPNMQSQVGNSSFIPILQPSHSDLIDFPLVQPFLALLSFISSPNHEHLTYQPS